MGRLHLQRILRELRESFRCPQCGGKFPLSQIEFRGNLANVYFVLMRCKDHVPIMVLARVSNDDAKLIIEKSVQITENDAIQFGQELSLYKGSLENLIKK